MDPARRSIAADRHSRQITLLPSSPRRRAFDGLRLAACSICLRVLSGAGWIDAERMIRMLRSYERQSPPRLMSALCPRCEETIRLRRAPAPEPLAA